MSKATPDATRVDSLTRGVKPAKAPTSASATTTATASAPATARALEALIAADYYLGRLLDGLEDIAERLLGRDGAAAEEELQGAVNGIHCLADIIATVGCATGVDTAPHADLELGRVALALQDLAEARARGERKQLSRVIEEQLLPSLARLAPAFPALEAQVAASA